MHVSIHYVKGQILNYKNTISSLPSVLSNSSSVILQHIRIIMRCLSKSTLQCSCLPLIQITVVTAARQRQFCLISSTLNHNDTSDLFLLIFICLLCSNCSPKHHYRVKQQPGEQPFHRSAQKDQSILLKTNVIASAVKKPSPANSYLHEQCHLYYTSTKTDGSRIAQWIQD